MDLLDYPADDDTPEELKRLTAKTTAHLHALLYLSYYYAKPDEALIWKAYQEFRRRGVSVPEEMLELLDQLALTHLKTASARSKIYRFERRFQIVLLVGHLIDSEEDRRGAVLTKQQRNEILQKVASSHGTTIANVRTICSRWQMPTRQRLANNKSQAIATLEACVKAFLRT